MSTIIEKLREHLDRAEAEQIKQLDQLVATTGLPVYKDPKTGALIWVDVRELRLRYMLSVNKIAKFIEGLAQEKLYYTECKKCGAKYFPPQVDCPRCKSSEMDWKEVSRDGELVTWTVINVKPSSFSHNKDYVVGIVKMPDGFNITAWVDTDPASLRLGMKMRLVVGRRPGENYVTYWFKPA
ncbi:Zn-ribbon domain-containing OB-fold protein [Pyrobaculum sp.]|uniref:Zn-ribbon domain-containing OB-fold protein n=1 Tax=Pyrobaculum sp. TaxID=2004705 RepID=UPI00317EB92A